MNNQCPFCDKSHFEERIVFENNDFFIIATLGQITDGGYLLLIPREHITCMGAATKEYLGKIDVIQSKIIEALKKEYHVPSISIFEHGIVGQSVGHAHIHFIPAECEVKDKIRTDFPQNEVNVLYQWTRLNSLYESEQKPYLIWQSKSTSPWKWVIWDPSPVPAQYLRIVYAEAIGRPERANWKNVDPIADRKLILETVSRMKKYFEG